MTIDVSSLVFVGLNSQVAALDSRSGATVWTWSAPKPWTRAYVSVLLLNDRQLIVSVNGYTYCLNPRTGHELWANDLEGFGTGVTSLEALGRHGSNTVVIAAAANDATNASAGAAPPG